MNTKEQLAALQDMQQLMNRSVRFLSFSGLSGMFAGLYACAAAFLAWREMDYQFYIQSYSPDNIRFFVLLALGTLVLALSTAGVMTWQKAQKRGEKIWDETAKNALVNLGTPLVVGGLFCLCLLYHGLNGLLAPTCLIFYGLALINGSKNSFAQLKQLGYMEVLLGLANSFLLGYGLLFWTIGFGVLHIIYGFYMHQKYDR